jgi:lactoylglutathione lyase
MIRIDHVALWTRDVDRLVAFYCTYFAGNAGDRYVNTTKGFESRFVSFDSGARLEIMKTTSLRPVEPGPGAQRMGLTHLALSVGSENDVNQLIERLRHDGHPIVDNPRRTGDGYYEGVALDPDGNRVEITA